jgi:membrane-associated protein
MEILWEAWAAILALLDMALHIDVHLRRLVEDYGLFIYCFLFLVVFCETGLVVTPFLPGDSLLFAGGTLAGAGMLNYVPLASVLLAAAVIGDAVNFRIGRRLGPPVFRKNYRLLKREYLDRAHAFYERHGGKAIVLARFIPIIRTFAPFVAGAAGMRQDRFFFFNVTGAAAWVFSLVSAGLFLGSLPFVRNNFSLIVYGIIALSLLPLLVEAVKRARPRRGAAGEEPAQSPPDRP